MRSIKKISASAVALLMVCSLCACSNNTPETSSSTETSSHTDSVTDTTVSSDTQVESTVTTDDNDVTDDFKYTVMTKTDYDKYGEDVLGKAILLEYTGESQEVDVPSTIEGVEVVAIGNGAFEGTNVTKVTLPNSISIIEDYAFSKCLTLAEINEISNLEFFGRCVFEETQWLNTKRTEDINEPSTEAESESSEENETTEADKTEDTAVQNTKGIVIYSGWLVDGNTCIGDIDLSNNSEIKAIAKDAFRLNKNLNSVNLTGSSIKFIDDFAFSDSSLAVIDFPICLERFGESVFSKCKSLENIDLTYTNITEISKNLFNDSAITNVSLPKAIEDTTDDTSEAETSENEAEDATENGVNIPVEVSDGIVKIGYGAFNNCINIKSIELGDKLVVIDNYAFAGTGIESINLPNSLETIGERAFSNCTQLSTVKFGNMIAEVGNEAFVKCEKLLEITIPKSLHIVGDHAFGYSYTTNDKNLHKVDGLQINCLKGSAIEKYCMNSDIKYNIIAST